jgi:hypothetical protein
MMVADKMKVVRTPPSFCQQFIYKKNNVDSMGQRITG